MIVEYIVQSVDETKQDMVRIIQVTVLVRLIFIL